MDEGQRLRFFESPMKEDAADDRPGLEYSSGKDSDMDMGEEVGEEVGEAVHMGEGMGVRARRAARQKGSSFGPMKEDADREQYLTWMQTRKEKKKRESKQEKKRNFIDVMSRQKPRTDAAGMWQCEMCSHHKRCKAVQSVHHLLHVAAAQITKAIRVASAHI